MRLLFVSLGLLAFFFFGCNIAPKSPVDGGDLSTDDGGGTTTGNAIVRLRAFSPHLLNGATQRIRVTPQTIRFRRQDNNQWIEHNLSNAGAPFVIQPTGIDFVATSELPFPETTYNAIEITLSYVRVSFGLLSFETTNSGPMRFYGTFQYDPSETYRLNVQPYADASATPTSNQQLAFNWQNAAGGLGGGPELRQHILFVTSTQVTPLTDAAVFDELCANMASLGASQGRLPSSLSWLGLISTSQENAKDRVVLRGNIYNANADGYELLSDPLNFWDPFVDWKSSQGYTETGAVASVPVVWTGSTATGEVSGATCLDWTSNSSGQNGAIGSLLSSNGNRMSINAVSCNVGMAVYCLSE